MRAGSPVCSLSQLFRSLLAAVLGNCLLQTAGGGGYGNPEKRDPVAVANDIAEGYVTEDAAKSVYRTEI